MHGKARLEPARHFDVLDCKLVTLHNTCQSMLAVCYIYIVHAVRLAVSPKQKCRWWAKTPAVFSRFWLKVYQIWGM